jgi:DNA-binding IclR family transcriptional regulator
MPRSKAIAKTKTTQNAQVATQRIRPVPAVTRALSILRLLGNTPSAMGVKAISQSLGLVTSTCLHILRVLVAEELVNVDSETKRYSLGVGMLSLARNVFKITAFASLVQPVLDRISKQYGVTAIGVETSGSEHIVAVALSRSQAPFPLQVDVGSRVPLLISATGRCVAAFGSLSPSEIKRGFTKLVWQNPPSFQNWRKEVADVRRNGYGFDRGNYMVGVTVIAVPLLGLEREVKHTIVAIGVTDQFEGGREVELALDMRAEAKKLSSLLYLNK